MQHPPPGAPTPSPRAPGPGHWHPHAPGRPTDSCLHHHAVHGGTRITVTRPFEALVSTATVHLITAQGAYLTFNEEASG
jgi:hypothetical protein